MRLVEQGGEIRINKKKEREEKYPIPLDFCLSYSQGFKFLGGGCPTRCHDVAPSIIVSQHLVRFAPHPDCRDKARWWHISFYRKPGKASSHGIRIVNHLEY